MRNSIPSLCAFIQEVKCYSIFKRHNAALVTTYLFAIHILPSEHTYSTNDVNIKNFAIFIPSQGELRTFIHAVITNKDSINVIETSHFGFYVTLMVFG